MATPPDPAPGVTLIEPAAPGAELPGGFPADGLSVDRSEIVAGGPSRDGIPSVDAPRFVSPEEAVRWVRAEHAVIGVVVAGDARAYPVHLVEHHQVVNDRIGETNVAITYDPLIDVARAYRTDDPIGTADDGRTGRLGVSGLIHRCNFVLYDRGDASLWSQFEGLALTGARSGGRFERVPLRVETLRAWRQRHPTTRVMRPPDPRRIDYRYSRYSSYWVSDAIPFPVDHVDGRIHPKEIVLGARIGDRTRAYLATVIERRGGRIVDEFEGRKIRIEWDGGAGVFSWEAPDDVEMTSAFWFAWKNFHPDTELWNVNFEPEKAARLHR